MSAPNLNPLSAGSVSGPPEGDTRGGRHGHKSKARFRTMSFPRKRAVTACDTCRWKKTKCGNERPICASCAKNNQPCSYDPRLDHASFDPASLLILDKLTQALQKLNEIDQEVKGKNFRVVDDLRSTTVAGTTTSPSAGACNNATPLSISPSDCLEVPTAFGSTEAMLTWPIFNGRLSHNFLSQELLIGSLPSGHGEHRDPLKWSQRWNHGINEEDIPALVERFLQLVHSKNPVFHTRQIREAARYVSEHGIGWDASSCVVLLACALGAVARPFNPSLEIGLLSGRTSLHDTSDLLQTSDVFYQVARKRIGLLDPSIMASQCYMLSGIYLMYTLHPLEAWLAFHQAGSTYSLYLKGQAALQERRNNMERSPLQSERQLEQRLYWTILKSECEIRVQLDLPQSDLCNLDYPFPFPSPSTPLSPAESPEDQMHEQGSTSAASTSSQSHVLVSTSGCQSAEEQSWFYYLSEIGLRRIENCVLNTFYKEDHQHWVQMDLACMTTAAREIEAQTETWHTFLPFSIRFDGPDDASDELRHMTKGRILLIRRLLYRPFLYYAIHATHQEQIPWDLASALQGFVQKSLATCLTCNTGTAITHRHHGTWYDLRESITAALMLLAAHAADLITINLQSLLSPQTEALDDNKQYARILQICVEKLRYWEAEAPPDISRARGIIGELMSGMDGNPN